MSMSPEAAEKIRKIIMQIGAQDGGEDFLRSALAAAGFGLTYKAETRKLPAVTDPERLERARDGIILDCEATGLKPKTDKVTQLAMLKIKFDEQGIISFGERFDRLRDPGMPIPQEVTDLTGITDAMVKGKQISDQEVADFMADPELVIAHNASYDRSMLEANFPDAGFERVRWDCTVEQIDWKARGLSSAKLELIAQAHGFTYDAHNAVSDILMLGHVLNLSGADGGRTAFAEMWENGSVETLQIVTVGAPFNAKDAQKERGYKFSRDGDEARGYPNAWHITIPGDEQAILEECEFLRATVFRKDVALPCFRLGALTRYSERWPQKETLHTTEPRDLIDAIGQMTREGGVVASHMQMA